MTPMEWVALVDALGLPVVIGTAWKAAGYVAKKKVDERFALKHDKAVEDIKHEHEKAVEQIRHDHTQAIEALKGDQSRGLEHLKGEVGASLNRITKLHQYEFDTIPEAWRLLHVAVGYLRTSAAIGLVQITDVSAMKPNELDEFIKNLPWPQSPKDELRAAADKQKVYNKYRERWEFGQAERSWGDLHNYLLEKGIFIERGLRDALRTVTNEIAEVVTERRIYLQMKGDGDLSYLPGERLSDYRKKADGFFKTYSEEQRRLESLLQDRLWTAQVRGETVNPDQSQQGPSAVKW